MVGEPRIAEAAAGLRPGLPGPRDAEVECNAHRAVERRLARRLLMAHDRVTTDAFPVAHEFLFLMLGVRRTGVRAAAGALQKAGLIRYARGRGAVTDRSGLEAASCGCYRTGEREFACLLGSGAARRPG